MSEHIRITLPVEWAKDLVELMDTVTNIAQSRHDRWLAQAFADAIGSALICEGIHPDRSNRGVDRINPGSRIYEETAPFADLPEN